MSDNVTHPSRKLVMAITELDVGGAERAFVRIAIGLQHKGWQVRVISLRDAGPLAAPLREAGIEVTALNCGGAWDVRAVTRMRSDLRRNRPDVLLTFLHQANIAGRLAAKLAGVKRVVCGIRVVDNRAVVRLSEWLTQRLVSHYTAVSIRVMAHHSLLCGIIGRHKVGVIHNGVDAELIDETPRVDRVALGFGPDDFLVLCAGRLTEQKAPQDVLAAFQKLFQQPRPLNDRPLRLLFVGDGPLRPGLESEVQKLGLSDRVRFAGQRDDLIGIMKSADVLVLASRWEGLPNVILEAHAAALPVIVSAVDGSPEVVLDGVTGRLFQSGDVDELSAIIGEAVREPHHFARMGLAARDEVWHSFTWEQCIEKFDAMLRKVAE